MEEKKKKRIAILGSTGSIGTQTLEVISQHPDLFEVELLTANHNADLLIQQALQFSPNAVVIADEQKYLFVKNALSETFIKVFAGHNAIIQSVQSDYIDIVLTAMVGFSGLKPTIEAIKHNKTIALANKETLVVAGELISKLTSQHNSRIIPVDSEHSAIFQCLAGEWHNPVEKIILTASGGPFRGKSIHELENVTVADALKHPNWTMGAKITIDSATLMNKGLEVIEARWLFDLPAEKIEVIVHPQSIVHSMVQFTDGSIKAQMGLPDMKLPIQYALAYPERLTNNFPRFSFAHYPHLSFEAADTKTFRCLQLAFDALHSGGNASCVLNAANEIAVKHFLQQRISFTDIADMVEYALHLMNPISNPSIDDLVETDRITRMKCEEWVED